ncbi:hypothetical protein J4475_02475 [Candidatus Woesearchaeota archaeon]|nr:hypothetical protein [Candidatus Woesearchaeota archaeon]
MIKVHTTTRLEELVASSRDAVELAVEYYGDLPPEEFLREIREEPGYRELKKQIEECLAVNGAMRRAAANELARHLQDNADRRVNIFRHHQFQAQHGSRHATRTAATALLPAEQVAATLRGQGNLSTDVAEILSQYPSIFVSAKIGYPYFVFSQWTERFNDQGAVICIDDSCQEPAEWRYIGDVLILEPPVDVQEQSARLEDSVRRLFKRLAPASPWSAVKAELEQVLDVHPKRANARFETMYEALVLTRKFMVEFTDMWRVGNKQGLEILPKKIYTRKGALNAQFIKAFRNAVAEAIEPPYAVISERGKRLSYAVKRFINDHQNVVQKGLENGSLAAWMRKKP